jgi:proton glutamate symport protein
MAWYRKLHWQIMLGLAGGLIYGLVSAQAGWNAFSTDFVKPVGTVFVTLLKLIAVPLVLASLIAGVANLNDIQKLSRMGGRTIGLYLLTTVFAITIGLTVVNVIKPWEALPEATRDTLMNSYSGNLEARTQTATKVLDQSPLQPIVDVVPENLFFALTSNSGMLQVVFIAVLFGIGIVQIKSEKSKILIDFFDAMNDVIIKIVNMIMVIAPYGVFALMSSVIIDLAGDDIGQALTLLQALGWYTLTVIIGLLIHLFLVYTTLFKMYSKMRLVDFLRAMRPALLLAFSTSSSAATLPVTMERVEKNLGVDEEVGSFVLPVGATINMDGTSLYQAVAAVFISMAIGNDITWYEQLTIVVTALLASIGSAAVPGAGIIMLVIVLKSVDVPVEGIALILGVDRILDMCRTVLNVTGDAAVAVVVAGLEGKLGPAHYDD